MAEISSTSVATVLFVDDEPGILSALRRLFRPQGYRILIAESGAGGLEIIEREEVDLVISDMRMPEMDGAQFLEQVRLRKPEIIRIMLTGYADITSTVAAINRGEIYRYISKPWDDSDIILIVSKALEHQRLEQENQKLRVLTQQQNEELRELNASLERRVAERTEEIEQTNSFLNLANDQLKKNFLLSIKMFSGLMELRGGNIAGHARRVGDLSRKLADKVGVKGKAQSDIFLAGLLHDIGKIGFPDDLLSTPVSKLEANDVTVYRKHVLTGETALMPLFELKEAAKMVHSHHERFDGLGFPDGLQGLAIPLGARIVAIANDYDGMQIGILSEKRSSAEEAIYQLSQGRGRRYDPQLVDAFIEMLGGETKDVVGEIVVSSGELKPGMVLARDLIGRDGVLLLAADYALDMSLVRQIHEYEKADGKILQVHVRTGGK